MKKLLLPLIAIFTVGILVGGSAYALFSDEVEVNGISLDVTDADLKISLDGVTFLDGPVNAEDDFNFTGLYPGNISYGQRFWLKNYRDFKLNITGKLKTVTVIGGTNDWEVLRDVVQAGISPTDDPNNVAEWYPLVEWSAGVDFPENPLEETRSYWMFMRIPLEVNGNEVGDEIANKALSDMTFVFTGTQAE